MATHAFTCCVRYKKLGGHYHCRIFTGRTGLTLSKAGDIIVAEDEWYSFIDMMPKAAFIDESVEEAKD